MKFNVVGDGTYGYKLIKTVGPGTLPKALRGLFTSAPEADKAITRYMSEKEKK